MKQLLLAGLFAAVTAPLLDAGAQSNSPFRSPPPPVHMTMEAAKTSAAPSGETYVYDQKPLPGVPVLVTKEQADAVVGKFKDAYPKLGNPKLLLYVNRDLVDTKSGMRLTSRNEKVDSARSKVSSTVEARPQPGTSSVTINAGRDVAVTSGHDWDFPGRGNVTRKSSTAKTENRYSTADRKQTLADRQTVRDVERLFGRPLRAAGAALADQEIATQLIANRPIKEMAANTEGEQARKDREALSKIADVVIEVLISSRNVAVPEVSGDKVYTAPDIQATAIRLSDSKIIGQAASRDVIGKDRYAGRALRSFDVQEIAEATALALMEDIAANTR